MNKKDRRYSNVDYEVRSTDEGDQLSIVGYALKFDKPSEDLGFIEYIDRSALDGVDMNNVVGLLNHDPNYVLSRSGRNMELEVDEFGLRFKIEPTNTSYTKNLIENMRVGLIDKCSFAFQIDYNDDDADSWERDEDGTITRTIHKIHRLFDVSVVTTPAYEDTEALLSTRSLDSMNQLKDARTRELELLDMELELLEDWQPLDINYTNEFLLNIIKKHIADYEEDTENIVKVVIGGETIGDNRITTFQIIAPNIHELYENTETKTGDPINLWS